MLIKLLFYFSINSILYLLLYLLLHPTYIASVNCIFSFHPSLNLTRLTCFSCTQNRISIPNFFYFLPNPFSLLHTCNIYFSFSECFSPTLYFYLSLISNSTRQILIFLTFFPQVLKSHKVSISFTSYHEPRAIWIWLDPCI